MIVAPLGKAAEFDEADFARKGDGEPAIPVTARIALASSHHLGGVRLLRQATTSPMAPTAWATFPFP